MKKIIRLTESDLIRLVRRVINEQTDNVEPLSNKSEGTEIDGITYKLSQIKTEDLLSRFTWPSASFTSIIPKEILKNVFGEDSENFKLTISKPKRFAFAISDVVQVLLTLNAVTGESSPITLEKSKNLLKTTDIDLSSVYANSYDALVDFSKEVDLLVKYKFDSDVFKYYSKLLQSKLTP